VQKLVEKTLICLAPFGDSGTSISVFGLGNFAVEWVTVESVSLRVRLLSQYRVLNELIFGCKPSDLIV
jgi:hypothetical protein